MASNLHILVGSVDDERLAAYTRLKERDLASFGRRFIAEGELVVRRLLASDYRVESLLVSTRHIDDIAPLARPDTPIYVAEPAVVNQIVGFKFHSGVMGVGFRGPKRPLADLAARWKPGPLTLMILPEIANTDNLGSLIRIGSGFGVDAMILGEHCCDPFYRHSIRVSMGSIFRMPLVESEDLLGDLRVLRERHGVELAATVLAEDAEPLASIRRPERLGLLFGNEAQGLRAEHVMACDRRLTIPMKMGTDSLNVSMAAAVFLYHFTQA